MQRLFLYFKSTIQGHHCLMIFFFKFVFGLQGNKHEPCKRSWCPMIKLCKFWFEHICFLALFFFHFYFSLNFNFFCFNCLYPIIMTIPLVGLGGRNWSYGKCPKFHSFLYGFPQPCGRKLKEHKYTQPLIGTPESFSDWSLESQSQL